MGRYIAVIVGLILIFTGCAGEGVEPSPSSGAAGSREAESASTADLPEEEPQEEAQAFLYALDPRLPEGLRALVSGNRAPVFEPADAAVLEAELEKYLYVALEAEADARIAAQVSPTPLPYPESLTLEQVEAELDFLFDYLKYGYSGYGYFGGDEFFLSAKADIVKEAGALERDLSVEEYQGLVTGYLLPVLMDRHFSLGDVYFGDPYAYIYYSYNEDVVFTNHRDGFHTLVDNVDYLLLSVDGNDPEDYVKPVLTRSGEMAWAIGINHNAPIEMAVELVLSPGDNGENLVLEVPLTAAPETPVYSNGTDYAPYERYEAAGIPVIHNRRLWTASPEDEESLAQMVAEAAELRDAPALIVDLRGNGGGSDSWAVDWVEAFTGVSPVLDNVYCVLETQTVVSSYGEEEAIPSPGWREPRVVQAELIPNDTFTVVLVDKNVGSSGELFLKYLRQMENVVIVGTNTMGCSMFGDARRICLPESHLVLQCGYKLFLEPDLSFVECIGLMPDLWAPPDEALERAGQLILSELQKFHF